MGGIESNDELRRVLEEIGWSPYELARKVNRLLPTDRRIHAKTPFAWRDRGTVPRDPLPSIIAGVLTEARGELVGVDRLWPGRAPSAIWQPATAGMGEEHWCPADVVGLLGKGGYVGEGGPTYFPVSGSELISAARLWTFGCQPMVSGTARPGNKGVSVDFVDYLESDLACLRRLDDGHGGKLLRRAVELRLAHVAEVLRDRSSTTALTRRTFAVAGQMAQMVGWLAFDLGEDGLAQRMYLVGLRAAAAAGDRPLGALILSCIAQQQTWRDRSGDAVSIMEILGQLEQQMPPRVQALLAMRRARAFAATGRHRATALSLDQAFEALGPSRGEQAPQWAYWLNDAVLSGEAGRCYLLLGDRDRAAAHLSEGLSRIDDDSARDKVLYGLSLALTHVPGAGVAGDLEMACYQAEQVLPLLPRVGSARCRGLLGAVMAELKPHRRAASVRALVDKSESLEHGDIC